MFTVNDTNFAKGIALCLLLIHHLFYIQSTDYIDILINGRQFSNIVSELSKVCVAIFLILSGYGVTESTNRKHYSLRSFYLRYLKKIYFNYWLMWIVFVPIGVLYFGRSLESVYVDHILSKLILNILGVHMFFGYYGYNATWWFISAILLFYVLFPWLKIMTDKYKKWFLFFAFVMIFLKFIPAILRLWAFPFILGIFISQNDLFVKFKNTMNEKKIIKFLIYVVSLALIALLRIYGASKLQGGIAIDGIFGLIIILFSFEYFTPNTLLHRFVTFIGKHSFNIFLFHTFIYGYYFHEFSYILRYPPFIFLQLLLICLVISLLLEKLKTLLSKFTLKRNKLRWLMEPK